MFSWIASPEGWVALATLTSLEIVLGIDNIIFISILVGRLPIEKRNFARRTGLMLAMLTRLALLFSIVWVANLTQPWFSVLGIEISGRDIILIGGGLFLLAKATHEIHSSLEGIEESRPALRHATLAAVLFQIAVIDIVFSLDSVITAVGLAQHRPSRMSSPLTSTLAFLASSLSAMYLPITRVMAARRPVRWVPPSRCGMLLVKQITCSL